MMTPQGFRFIHASDFRLEEPVDGLASLPERYGEAILDAPRRSAERVFDAALKEKVDFVVLSGNLLSARDTGPQGVLFLLEQFERLNAAKIPVYWAAGLSDSPDVFPPAFRLPANVHVFPVGVVEETFYMRDGSPVARLLGTSRGKAGVVPRYAPTATENADDLYTIGVYCGRLSAEVLKTDATRYWALGGERERATLSRSPSLAVIAGSPVARNFGETGEYGATLVEVSETGRAQTTPIRTSTLRWSVETLSITEDQTEDETLAAARSRLKALQDKETTDAALVGRAIDENIWFVAWRADAEGAALTALRYGTTAQTILRDLRSDFGKTAPVFYSVDFEANLPERLAEDYYERQTILGDYLRMIRYYEENEEQGLNVDEFMPESARAWAERERLRRAIAKRRREDGEVADVSDLASRLKALDERDYPAETSALYALASLDAPEGDDEKGDSRDEAEKLEERRRALREAAALGVDLLSETDGAAGLLAGLTTKSLTKKNRVISAELRNFQKNLDEKEIGS